ncbi:TEA/ATTS domain family-domain-containing protein [Kickxella alabastrina]|uniref:TEA/ATTS domain family-domain-containing protein n=1 Tax=Kickxella alabastrina TaxID=61397 RepID=UPI00221EED6C|nr:TEA/ATTS domain family-domain-containing protein [Kickxella alabastrina]KAI7825791.1 TEA/ATTS domain family-domain-containing protein [Kickxella alabastrina]
MDAKTVRALLADLDVESYHSATVEVLTDEEVWPPEIEDSFLKAAHLFATVGQRKYQLDPKMPNSRTTELSGRNDIISRYIFMMTGRFRARKQVSSHIQVWAHCKRAPSSHNMNLTRSWNCRRCSGSTTQEHPLGSRARQRRSPASSVHQQRRRAQKAFSQWQLLAWNRQRRCPAAVTKRPI